MLTMCKLGYSLLWTNLPIRYSQGYLEMNRVLSYPSIQWLIAVSGQATMIVYSSKHDTMLLSAPPRSQSASTGPEEPRKKKKQPNAGRVDQLLTKAE